MKQSTVSIDLTKAVGKIKPMHGVNNGPIPKSAFRDSDNFDSFKALGVPVIRLHDSAFFSAYGGEHTVDVGNIFPDFDADENDPDNYDFTLTDYYCRSCCDTGAKLLYRLGSKIEHEPKKYQTKPPKDFAKWARICEHIIRHLCYGWADGLTLDIPLWEIWNEADNRKIGQENWNRGVEHNPCWQGTIEQFHEFYAVVAKHLKAAFPELQIGGPAYTRSFAGHEAFEAFVKYAKENGVPLDFYSWHRYGTDPHRFAQDAEEVRAVLDQNGFCDTKLILDEWNYINNWRGDGFCQTLKAMQSEKGAAFNAACMIAAQKSPMDFFTYYDARGYCEFNGLWEPFTFYPLKGYYAFGQFNTLYRMGTECKTDSDNDDLYVCAATDGKRSGILLAYFKNDPLEETSAEIHLTGMKGKTAVTTRLTDAEHTAQMTRKDVFATSEGSVFLTLKENSFVLLETEPIA